MTLPDAARLAALSDADLASFRGRLAELGYASALVQEAEAVARSPLRQVRGPVTRAWLAGRAEPAAALARLFAFEDRLPEADVRALLGGALCDALLAADLLVAADGGLRARYLVYPMADGLYVLSDYLWGGPGAAMGPGAGTAFLARLLPPAFSGSLLDVGCGAGSLALLARRRGARRAVGVDINPRAVEVGRFNARLNGVELELEAGDLTAPVRGQRFDCVVAQPAFVARPPDTAQVTYLHGGVRGDELAFRLLGELPGVLDEGGRGLVFFQAPEDPRPLSARVRDALGEAAPELDVLALRGDGASPALQAMVFASYEAAALDEGFETAMRRYLGHFTALGATRVDGILAVVGRPEEARARYAMALPLDADLGAEGLGALLARLGASAEGDEALLRIPLRAAPDARVTSERAGLGKDAPAKLSLVLPRGVGGEVTRDLLDRLAAFTPQATPERALQTYARTQKRPPAALRGEWLTFVRESLVRGRLVLPAGDTPRG